MGTRATGSCPGACAVPQGSDRPKACYLGRGSTGTGSLQVKLTFAEEAAGLGRVLLRAESVFRSDHPVWLFSVTELIRFVHAFQRMCCYLFRLLRVYCGIYFSVRFPFSPSHQFIIIFYGIPSSTILHTCIGDF